MTEARGQVPEQAVPFLQRVMNRANLPDIYDARDITVVIYRTMRDMMTTATSDAVAAELQTQAMPGNNPSLSQDIAYFWKDTNPIVAFLSRIRPPLEIDADTFLFRINQEAGVPREVTVENAIKAVFSATKEELSQERIQEIAACLPDKIRAMWNQA